MTSKPEPKRRDLGPPLALAGLGVVVVAVIAGFIAVGGPGDTRDRRLDDMTIQNLQSLATEALCAFDLTGKTYASLAEVKSIAERPDPSGNDRGMSCMRVYPDIPAEGVTSDGNVSRAGDLSYARIDDTRIKLCGYFRREQQLGQDKRPPRNYDPSGRFPEFDAPHPAGKHCYELNLSVAPRGDSQGGIVTPNFR